LVKFCGWRPWHFAALALALLAPAVWAAHRKALRTGQKDPRVIVIDEVLGQWVTLAGAAALNWKSWLAAFLLFRLFDILKPFPIRRLEGLPGGFGIVADDLAAGIYGALVLFAAGCFNLY
jgi:phosphatidylglycerophosphatase A